MPHNQQKNEYLGDDTNRVFYFLVPLSKALHAKLMQEQLTIRAFLRLEIQL